MSLIAAVKAELQRRPRHGSAAPIPTLDQFDVHRVRAGRRFHRSVLGGCSAPLFVATPETIWRLEDKNGDGEALDAGEKTPFLDAAPGAAAFVDVAASRSGLVYAIDSSGRVFKSQDLNNDGDAKDLVETMVFHD